MIGFSFTYTDDGHEVREDIHGLALKANGEWGHVIDDGLPRYDEGFGAGDDLRLGQTIVADVKLLGPKESSVALHHDGAMVAEFAELHFACDHGNLQLTRADGTFAAFVAGDDWWLSGGPRRPDRKLGPVIFLFEGQRLEMAPVSVPLGPRSRLSPLAARARRAHLLPA